MQTFDAVRRLADRAVGPTGERLSLSTLRGQTVTAVAGIARPAAFFDMLRARGLVIGREVALPDHADTDAYTGLLETAGPVVCTEKDAVKFFPSSAAFQPDGPPNLWAVPLELTPEPAFFSAVEQHLPHPLAG